MLLGKHPKVMTSIVYIRQSQGLKVFHVLAQAFQFQFEQLLLVHWSQNIYKSNVWKTYIKRMSENQKTGQHVSDKVEDKNMKNKFRANGHLGPTHIVPIQPRPGTFDR